MQLFTLLVVCVSCCLAAEPWMPRELGRFKLPHAGFVEVYDKEDGGMDMYFTTFNPALPFFHDPVFFLENPGDMLDSVDTWADHLHTLGVKASAYWPNFPVKMPSSVLGFEGIAQTSGFLVPGKSDGKIELFDTSKGEQGKKGPIDIAAGQDHNWSYHWVLWKDIDNDGFLDAFTARFRVPTFGDPISELVWFQNPGTAPPAAGKNWPWQHFVQVTGGPDVYFEEEIFEVCNPDCYEISAIVTGELWTERIMIYYVINEPGAWAIPTNIKSMVVDAAPGQPFEAHFADLNNDGVLEILASCYDTREGNETGNFWVYEQNWEDPEMPWKRSSLSSGFIANPYLFGNSMAPGKSRLFWPSEEYKSTPTEFGDMPKPWIALSGDDDGIHWVMFPSQKTQVTWSMICRYVDDIVFLIPKYIIKVMVDTEDTTAGTMAVADLDGDGYTEIVSAGYTAGEVYVYTFAP